MSQVLGPDGRSCPAAGEKELGENAGKDEDRKTTQCLERTCCDLALFYIKIKDKHLIE